MTTTTRTKRCMICGHPDDAGGITYELVSYDTRDPDGMWILACVDHGACEERQREAALAALVDPDGDVPHDLF